MAIRGVITDVDGTLVDSNDAKARAWTDALAECGLAIDFADVRRLIGMGGDQLLPAVAAVEKESALGKRVTDLQQRIFREHYQAEVRPFPDADALLDRIRERGLRLAAASSGGRDEIEDLIRLADPHRRIELVVSGDDVEPSKPEPDLFGTAVARLGLAARDAIALGDTPYDVAAATKAGLRIVGFRCGGWSASDLGGAIEVYDGPADLLARWERSILGRAGGQGVRRAA